MGRASCDSVEKRHAKFCGIQPGITMGCVFRRYFLPRVLLEFEPDVSSGLVGNAGGGRDSNRGRLSPRWFPRPEHFQPLDHPSQK